LARLQADARSSTPPLDERFEMRSDDLIGYCQARLSRTQRSDASSWIPP